MHVVSIWWIFSLVVLNGAYASRRPSNKALATLRVLQEAVQQLQDGLHKANQSDEEESAHEGDSDFALTDANATVPTSELAEGMGRDGDEARKGRNGDGNHPRYGTDRHRSNETRSQRRVPNERERSDYSEGHRGRSELVPPPHMSDGQPRHDRMRTSSSSTSTSTSTGLVDASEEAASLNLRRNRRLNEEADKTEELRAKLRDAVTDLAEATAALTNATEAFQKDEFANTREDSTDALETLRALQEAVQQLQDGLHEVNQSDEESVHEGNSDYVLNDANVTESTTELADGTGRNGDEGLKGRNGDGNHPRYGNDRHRSNETRNQRRVPIERECSDYSEGHRGRSSTSTSNTGLVDTSGKGASLNLRRRRRLHETGDETEELHEELRDAVADLAEATAALTNATEAFQKDEFANTLEGSMFDSATPFDALEDLHKVVSKAVESYFEALFNRIISTNASDVAAPVSDGSS